MIKHTMNALLFTLFVFVLVPTLWAVMTILAVAALVALPFAFIFGYKLSTGAQAAVNMLNAVVDKLDDWDVEVTDDI